MRLLSSRTGTRDGSELEAVERCCTRKRLLSRVGEGIYVIEVTAVRVLGDRGPYRKRGEVVIAEPDRVRARLPFRRSMEGWWNDRVGGLDVEGVGSVSECLGRGLSSLVVVAVVVEVVEVVERTLSLWDLTDVGRLRAGVEGSFKSSSPAEMGSSCNSSPLKSVMMLLQSELSDSREGAADRGKGVLEEADAMTRLRSTSLTLMLLRLCRLGTAV